MDEDSRRKATVKRKLQKEVRRKYNLSPPLKTIRLNCLNCMRGSANQVKHCQVVNCKLWVYRFGRYPTESDMMVSVFDANGELVGQRPLHEVITEAA